MRKTRGTQENEKWFECDTTAATKIAATTHRTETTTSAAVNQSEGNILQLSASDSFMLLFLILHILDILWAAFSLYINFNIKTLRWTFQLHTMLNQGWIRCSLSFFSFPSAMATARFFISHMYFSLHTLCPSVFIMNLIIWIDLVYVIESIIWHKNLNNIILIRNNFINIPKLIALCRSFNPQDVHIISGIINLVNSFPPLCVNG